MVELKSKPSVNIFCKFNDRNLEAEFALKAVTESKKYIKPVIIGLSVLFVLFTISDIMLIKKDSIFLVLAGRSAYLVFNVLLLFLLDRINDPKTLSGVISLSEIFGLAVILLVFSKYEEPNFIIQDLGLIIIIAAIFLIPNSWLNTVIISSAGSLCFFLLSLLYIRDTKVSVFWSGVVDTALVIILCGMASFWSNSFRRHHYVDKKGLEKLSTTDPLTGLHNRAKLYEELQMWMNFSSRYKLPLSLVIFDIDDFKKINDEFGHLAGDRAIKEITGIIGGIIRETDILARWGGDEFIMLLPHTNRPQAVELSERIRSSISNHAFEMIGTITCSFGIASLNRYMASIEQFISRSDESLYKAKKSGKNVVMY